jgi:hypothetical protein
MIEDEFIELIDPVLIAAGSAWDVGEEFREPPLDVLRYYRRAARLGRLPFLARAQSVVSVVRQPVDVDGSREGLERVMTRAAMAANTRFPPWKGLILGLTIVLLTPEPIGAGDDAVLSEVLAMRLRRMRVVPFGILKINLAQEAMAMAIGSSPEGAFTEAVRLADVFCERFRRYVPLLEM